MLVQSTCVSHLSNTVRMTSGYCPDAIETAFQGLEVRREVMVCCPQRRYSAGRNSRQAPPPAASVSCTVSEALTTLFDSFNTSRFVR